METNQMKNIIVLKDLPSNIVDEAIVILKSNSKVKKKEIIENKSLNGFSDNKNGGYDFAVKEAEYIIEDYIKSIERPKEMKKQIKNMNIKYKKLQISSFLLVVTTIICIAISILK